MITAETPVSLSWRDTLTNDSVYFIAFAWLFGQNIWQGFFGGIIAHRALTRKQFTVLQAHIFPVYFTIQSILSSILLGIWLKANLDEIRGNYLQLSNTSVQQAWVLMTIVAMSFVNWFYIGPVTNAIIVKRQRQEQTEGKPYYDPGVSSHMKGINKEFSKWHGFSALANLLVAFALLYHGMWLANFGIYNKSTKAVSF
ncbi:hypothetical protein M408DRAFT_329105 [Serendipita vermifera MAFF 305830]|uniref:TMEM205-like domain-containing protein n=1 Tax=Serendipita vermifera MAFF 305830 TaxID=933852 RepID=A0A0C3BAI8_SERVB|nr:hypothetical protein M408DRAFT_329105 [Serendipita vermifera MAFF 305830]